MTTAATAATAAATAAAETVAETAETVVETIVDNGAKLLVYAATVAGSALAVGWLVRRFGERSMTAAQEQGLLTPPAPLTVVPALYDDGDQGDEFEQEWGDTAPAGSEWAR